MENKAKPEARAVSVALKAALAITAACAGSANAADNIKDFDTIQVVGVRGMSGGLGSPPSWFDGSFAHSGNDRNELLLWEEMERNVPELDKSPRGCAERSKHPIVFTTGNKLLFEADFTSEGVMPLDLARTYNWFSTTEGIFGRKWGSTFDSQLSTDASGGCKPKPGTAECSIFRAGIEEVFLHQPDGKQLKFVYGTRNGAEGWYSQKSTPLLRLTYEFGTYENGTYFGTWLLRTEDNHIERYSRGGYILERFNDHGIGWKYTYGGTNGTQLQRVTHTSGRYVEFGWSGNRVAWAKDPTGAKFSYGYTGNLLQSVTNPDGSKISYHYEDSKADGALTGKSFGSVRYSKYSYRNGLAFKSELAGGVESSTFTYTHNAGFIHEIDKAKEVNALGYTTEYLTSNGQVSEVRGLQSANCPARSKRTTFDSRGFVDNATDFVGNTTDYDYDSHGHLLKKVEALGTPQARTTTYSWDESTNRLSRHSVAGLMEVSYTYTETGRLSRIRRKDLASGDVRDVNFTYTFHSNRMLSTAKVDAPGTAADLTFRYSAAGDLLSITKANGQIEEFSNYNARGQAGRIKSPDGSVAEYEFDALGRVTVVRTFPAGSKAEDRHNYGVTGLLESVSGADGSVTNYYYDGARRLVREERKQPGGGRAVKRYTYNLLSNVTKVEVTHEN